MHSGGTEIAFRDLNRECSKSRWVVGLVRENYRDQASLVSRCEGRLRARKRRCKATIGTRPYSRCRRRLGPWHSAGVGERHLAASPACTGAAGEGDAVVHPEGRSDCRAAAHRVGDLDRELQVARQAAESPVSDSPESDVPAGNGPCVTV